MLEYNQTSDGEPEYGHNEMASLVNKLFQKDELLRYIKKRLNGELDKNKISVNGIEEIIKSIEQHLGDKDEEIEFKTHFNKVYDNFLNRIKEMYPAIGSDWLMICAYIRMRKSTNEISFLLNIPIEILEVRYSRLKKKLELDKEVNLIDYILNF
jgi:hypothetical protein